MIESSLISNRSHTLTLSTVIMNASAPLHDDARAEFIKAAAAEQLRSVGEQTEDKYSCVHTYPQSSVQPVLTGTARDFILAARRVSLSTDNNQTLTKGMHLLVRSAYTSIFSGDSSLQYSRQLSNLYRYLISQLPTYVDKCVSAKRLEYSLDGSLPAEQQTNSEVLFIALAGGEVRKGGVGFCTGGIQLK